VGVSHFPDVMSVLEVRYNLGRNYTYISADAFTRGQIVNLKCT